MLSTPHLIIVFIVVLIVFGPQKLPELARNLGKIMAEFRKASTDFKMAFEEEMRNIERQAREAEWKKAQAAAASKAANDSGKVLTEEVAEVPSLPAPAEAEEDPEPKSPAKLMDPVISPIAEAVPRSSGAEPIAPAPTPAPAAAAEDAVHDHEQPA
jgi:sec-independent protein translocase protein TatB